MPDIVIVGNLSEVSARLRRIKEVIANRVATGYPKFQHEDEWQYHTVQDNNVCPTCVSSDGQVYRGDYVLEDFQFCVSVSVEEIMVHNETNFHAAEKCRCTANWVNMHEALVERLFEELESAVE
jgi:hypothetical protein